MCGLTATRPIPAKSARRAFTLIEVIVTIGVVMILVGIWMPAIAGAWHEAQLTKWSSTIRQGVVVLGMYQNDHSSYPLRRESARQSTIEWALLAEELEYVPSARSVDPVLADPERMPTVHLSMCVTVKPNDLALGRSPGAPAPRAVPVREDMIAFPASKGVLLRYWVDPTVRNPTSFCCGPLWRTPVGMADGSVSIGTWKDFTLEDDLNVVDLMYGIPVFSTWGGYLARDR